MGVQRSTGGAGIQDHGTAATRVGLWHASGLEGRSFVAGDPAFSVLRVPAASVPD